MRTFNLDRFAPAELSRTAVCALAVAAFALGQALQAGDGLGNPAARLWLAVGLGAALIAVANPRVPWVEARGEAAPLGLLIAGLAWQLGDLLLRPPGMYVHATPDFYAWFLRGLALAAVLAGATMARGHWARRLCFPLLLATHFLLGVWMLHASPNPWIDVVTFHREAFRALRAGHDPYAITIPNIYGNSAYYGEGVVVGGRVMAGYPYPPLSLALTFLADLLTGDYRYALLVALTGAGAWIGYARPGRLSEAAAALLLFSPRVFFVLEQGWTDSLSIFFLAAVVFLAARQRRWLGVGMVLLLASKQYLFALVPLWLLLLPRPLDGRKAVRSTLAVFAAAMAATVFPVIFGPEGFWRSVVTLQMKQPFRLDSLSFLASWAQAGGHPSIWLGFALLVIALAFGLLRAPRTPAGFAAAAAFALLVFFAFSKQAFCNYYFLVIGALCAAAASPIDRSAAPLAEGVHPEGDPVPPERSSPPAESQTARPGRP